MRRLRAIVGRYGIEETLHYARALLRYAERLMRAAIAQIPVGIYPFADELDDDGITSRPLPSTGESSGPQIRVAVTVQGGEMTVDFTGSSHAVAGPLNAVRAITESATWYVARCLAGPDVPVNSGTFTPIRVIVPRGSLLDADPPHAVAGGNVETSQRIVDAVLGALAQALPDQIPAASLGTMNNLTVGGYDHTRSEAVDPLLSAWPGSPKEALEEIIAEEITKWVCRRCEGTSHFDHLFGKDGHHQQPDQPGREAQRYRRRRIGQA